MSKTKKTGLLIIALGALILTLSIVVFNRSKHHSDAVKIELTQIDTSAITGIDISLKGTSDSIMLLKEGNDWVVLDQGLKTSAELKMAHDLVNQLSNLKATAIITHKPEQWAEYDVTDSTANRVKLMCDNTVVADVLIGKFNFNHQSHTMTSFVRLFGQNEVYAVESFLSVMLGRNRDAFKNHTVIDNSIANWTKLVFAYGADTGFTLIKEQNQWLIDGILADSVKVSDFLASIANLGEFQFSRAYPTESRQPAYKVTLEGNNMTPIIVKGYIGFETNVVVTSSLNRGNVMVAHQTKDKLFISKASLKK